MARLATRQIRLKADNHAPAAARAAVRDVLAETDLTVLLDAAVLLATEVTTNAVLHAGTDIDVRIDVDEARLRVSVTDGHRGELPTPNLALIRQRVLSPGGRGLSLVDAIADVWGTTHDREGKTVWFELLRPVDEDVSEPAGDEEVADGVIWYAQLGDPTTRERVGQIITRLAGWPGVAGVGVRLDRADGQGQQDIAATGKPTDDEIRVRVPLAPPWRGVLAVHAAPGAVSGEVAPGVREVAEVTAQALGLLLDNDRLRGDDLRLRASLRFTAEASDLLAQSLDVELTTALIPRLVVPRLGSWCAIYRCDDGGIPQLATVTHTSEAATSALVAALAALANRRVLDDTAQSRHPGTLSAGVDGIAVPMSVGDRVLGVLAIGRPALRRHDTEELGIVEDLARRAGLALDNAQLHADRRRIADTLQHALLPPTLPDVEGVRFAAEYIPALAATEVGGDFYDVLPMSGNRFLMVLGDVSGKGLAAATVTGLVRDVIRILVREERSVPEILRRLNETLAERAGGRYATLATAEVRPQGSRLAVRVHLAGHDRPILVRTDGATDAVGSNGSALGLLPAITTTGVEVFMAPGDTLVFFTDGVTERRRGAELFGVDRVRRVLAPLAGHDADIVAARLRAATLGFSTEAPRDDIAILALRNDLPAPGAVTGIPPAHAR